MAVAGGSGRGIDDGLSLADQTVEEGAFADIRTAHDCYETHTLFLFSDAKIIQGGRKTKPVRVFPGRIRHL